MKPSEREQLLGYLLGALDDAEMEAVRRELESNPDWRTELQQLELSLKPLLRNDDHVDPPSGLAEDACDLVATHTSCERITNASSRLSQEMRSADGARNRASFTDSVVAAGIFLAVALLFFPAISNSRLAARRLQCQNNLRLIGIALAGYSEKAGAGYFPWVPAVGKRAFAGIYAPILLDGGYLADANIVICPSSDLARRDEVFRIPSLPEIDLAEGGRMVQIRQTAGGSYGYSLGVVVDGRHSGPPNRGRSHFALAGDAPNTVANWGRANHGGNGQNLLFEDGHVSFLVASRATEIPDDPFRNRLGAIEAGIDREDAVVAPSFFPPFFDGPRDIQP